MRKAFQYKVKMSPSTAGRAEGQLALCRELYNAALQERRDAYRSRGISLNGASQSRQLPEIKEVRPEYRGVDAQVLQDVIKRLDRAYRAFFRRVQAGQAPGYPRFKSRRRYDLIAVEDLNIRGLARGMLAKSVHDAGWGQFIGILCAKAGEAARTVVAVDPRGTSQVCSGCGCEPKVKKTLAVRTHHCAECGLILDRDVNAARNILHLGSSKKRVGAPPSGSGRGCKLAA